MPNNGKLNESYFYTTNVEYLCDTIYIIIIIDQGRYRYRLRWISYSEMKWSRDK